VVLVLDDMGFSDIGLHGSDIHTTSTGAPEGLCFTNYHTARCARRRERIQRDGTPSRGVRRRRELRPGVPG
jgi:hypothetical protein